MIGPIDSAVLGAYALAVLATGAVFVRGQAGSEGFLLADRTLGTGRVFAATFSTFHGTGIVFTFASFGYLYGVGAVLLPVAAVVGFLPLALAAPRIRALSDRRDAITLPELVAGSWSTRTRALAALVTGALFAAALAVNVRVAGVALEVLLDVPLRSGVVGFGIVVVAQTTLGGFRGVVWTDVLQMAVVVATVLLILPAAVVVGAGPGVVGAVPPGHLDPLGFPAPLVVVYLLVGAFTFFGSQDLLQRIYAARGGREARRGLLLFVASLVVVGPTAVGLGIAGRGILPTAGADGVLFALTGGVVPAELVGVVLLGYLALANSDADSQLLTVTSTLTRDVLPALDVDLGNLEGVWVDRITVVGVGTIAVALAATIPDLVALLGGLGTLFGILGVAVVATLYWDATTDAAAFAGIVAGIASSTVVVVATGTVQVAPIVGVVLTGATVVTVTVLDGRVAGTVLESVQ